MSTARKNFPTFGVKIFSSNSCHAFLIDRCIPGPPALQFFSKPCPNGCPSSDFCPVVLALSRHLGSWVFLAYPSVWAETVMHDARSRAQAFPNCSDHIAGMCIPTLGLLLGRVFPCALCELISVRGTVAMVVGLFVVMTAVCGTIASASTCLRVSIGSWEIQPHRGIVFAVTMQV